MQMSAEFNPFHPEKPVEKSRRNLPHWFQKGCTVFITFRLADSLPESLLGPWRDERNAWCQDHPTPWGDREWREYHARFTRRIEDWLDAGRGECWLRQPSVRQKVEDCIQRFHGERLQLSDYILMPNHVHLLLTPIGETTLSAILKGIKGASARECNLLLGRTGAFWMDENFDHLVRSARQWDHFRKYIRDNPAKAGLPASEFTYWSNHPT